MAILEASGITKFFTAKKNIWGRAIAKIRAVDNVSLSLEPGQTLGLVGESGCGKSTLGRTLLRLCDIDSGNIVFDGVDITKLDRSALRMMRQRMQMVFQDPVSSLNPRMKIRDIIGEPLIIHKKYSGKQLVAEVNRLVENVGLNTDSLQRYPHEFSGGQKQRIGIARAIALRPQLVIADEPVSALDVSIQSQILNLLSDLKESFGLSYIFIAHDLAVVEHIGDKIAVMYLGRIVEYGESDKICLSPKHPYSKALIAAVPEINVDKNRTELIAGDLPSPLDPPAGCHFAPRCPMATELCRRDYPELRILVDGRKVACHHV